MFPADDPVSLTAGIIAALVGLAIALPIVVQLLRERSFIKARDEQWEKATAEQQEQLKHIYALRADLDDRLREVSHRDFALEAVTLQAYDALIDTSWATRGHGGLEAGIVMADELVERAASLKSTEDVEGLNIRITEAVRKLEGRGQRT